MSRQRTTGTAAELALRKELHRRGLRYRIDRAPVKGLRRKADVVFGPSKVAVMVDGCFWHGCPQHATQPQANEAWWREKLARNVERDRDTDARLQEAGWLVLRVWEHEPVSHAADRVAEAVRSRAPSQRPKELAHGQDPLASATLPPSTGGPSPPARP